MVMSQLPSSCLERGRVAVFPLPLDGALFMPLDLADRLDEIEIGRELRN